MPDLLSPSESAAHGARLSQASFIASPSLISTGMAGALARYNTPIEQFESQSSAMNAAMAASAIGKRVFIPVSGPQAGEFYSASFQRLPVVAFNASRFMGAYTSKNDLNDIMALRDAGWIIFLAENNQEILDTLIMAFRISEEVSLPSIVNINGIYARETVTMPNEKKVVNFLPKPRSKIDFKKPSAFNAPVEDYMEFRAQQQKAMENALSSAEKISSKWKEKFNRSYSAIEKYMLEDADYAFVAAGSNAGTCRETVDALRAQGEKVGMLRIRLLRPFPGNAVIEALKNVKKTAVVDESISLGSSGILYAELAQYYHGFACNFIAGLGRYLTAQHFTEIFQHLKKTDAQERLWLL